MEKLNRYREIVRALIEEYGSHKISHGQIDSYPVIDSVGDHYLAMSVGWDQQRRVQNPSHGSRPSSSFPLPPNHA